MINSIVELGKTRGQRWDREARGFGEKAYKFSDLSSYTFRQRLTIRALDLAFYGLINAIGRTMRFEVKGAELCEDIARQGRTPIYAFWHDCILATTYWWRQRGIVVMTSQSFDGEYIARFIQRFGYGAARGSATRGSIGAIIEMIRLMRRGLATAFTIDGPKGPRHVAKMGAVLLAKKTGQPVIPCTTTVSSCWEMGRSWDRFQIPRPFSRARVEVAAPIFVNADADDGELEARRCELQVALDDLDQRGQEWRAGLSSPAHGSGHDIRDLHESWLRGLFNDSRALDDAHRFPLPGPEAQEEYHGQEDNVGAGKAPCPVEAPVIAPRSPGRHHHERPGHHERNHGHEARVARPAQREREDEVDAVEE
jgi:lysophospholipid acyltransferase (LPLAT)-like uncharacterized protein